MNAPKPLPNSGWTTLQDRRQIAMPNLAIVAQALRPGERITLRPIGIR